MTPNYALQRTAAGRLLVLVVALSRFGSLEAFSSPPQYKVYSDSEREPKGSITTWSATNSGDRVVFNFHNATSGSNWMVKLRLPDGQESQANTIDEREPKGSHNIFWASFDTRNGAFNPNIEFYLHNSVSGSNWVSSIAREKTITLPYILRDLSSGITYEVEADGRHVSATDAYGALLWYRDPFADAHLEYYRTHAPRIMAFDFYKKGREFISIRFNSSQFGLMDMKTGDFSFTGQD